MFEVLFGDWDREKAQMELWEAKLKVAAKKEKALKGLQGAGGDMLIPGRVGSPSASTPGARKSTGKNMHARSRASMMRAMPEEVTKVLSTGSSGA